MKITFLPLYRHKRMARTAISRSRRKKMKIAGYPEPPAPAPAPALAPAPPPSSPTFALVKCSKRSQKKQFPLQNLAASAKFMSVVPDDLLLEIFLRLPNGRSVIQSATVCKRWCSLVINPPHSAKFIGRFNEYHLRKQSLDSSYYPAYTNTILFKFTPRQNERLHYQLSSKEPVAKRYDLSYMPNWKRLIIRASSGYFLLISDRSVRQYFICNSLTRQWFALPEVPAEIPLVECIYHGNMLIYGAHGFTLLCDPLDNDIAQDRYRYRVVIVNECEYFSNKYSFYAAIYDSDTGLWTQPKFSAFAPCDMPWYHDTIYDSDSDLEIAIGSDGVLHWVDGFEGYRCLIVFDPLRAEVRLVPLPHKQFSCLPHTSVKWKVRLGVVQGRVRLSLMNEIDNQAHRGRVFSLKVWELDSNCLSWLLVHDVVLEETSGRAFKFFVLAFDPSDSNVLFMAHVSQIYRYKMDQPDKYEHICEFSHDDYVDFKVLTILHPLWPTPTLSLASTDRR